VNALKRSVDCLEFLYTFLWMDTRRGHGYDRAIKEHGYLRALRR
jgi:hypothetical protein